MCVDPLARSLWWLSLSLSLSLTHAHTHTNTHTQVGVGSRGGPVLELPPVASALVATEEPSTDKPNFIPEANFPYHYYNNSLSTITLPLSTVAISGGRRIPRRACSRTASGRWSHWYGFPYHYYYDSLSTVTVPLSTFTMPLHQIE